MDSPQTKPDNFEISDLRQYLRPVLSRWFLIVGIVVVVSSVVYVKASREPKTYTATTSVLLKSSSGLEAIVFGTPSYGDMERFAKNQAQLLTTRSAASRVAKRLRFKGDPGLLLSGLVAAPTSDTDFLAISATRDNPLDAAQIANAFAAEFVRMRANELRLDARKAHDEAVKQVARLRERGLGEEQLRELQSRINRLELVEAFPQANAEQLDKAVPPAATSGTSPRRQALFAGALAFLFAIGLCYGLEGLDRRLRRREDAEPLYGMPVLAELPNAREPQLTHAGKAAIPSEVKEGFRALRTNLQLGALASDKAPWDQAAIRTLLVTSAIAGEGKSMVVRNLAITYREAGMRVAVIDADLRDPDMAKLFSVEPNGGLLNVLTGSATLEDALQKASLRVDGLDTMRLLQRAHGEALNDHGASNGNGATNGIAKAELSILTGGNVPADPGSVLASERFLSVVESVAENHDVVLIDSPPLLPVSDAVPLLSAVDAVVLVTRLGFTTRSAARRVSDIARRSPSARLMGIVVNDTVLDERYGYGYTHYGSPRSDTDAGRHLVEH